MKKSIRFDRNETFTVKAHAKDVFPLLCPVREYDWLPGWSCTMYYADSGVAEKDAIFHTKEKFGRKAVWTLITYEPDSFIEYLIVSGKDAVVRLSIALTEESDGTTKVGWTMRFTMTSAMGRAVLTRQFSQAGFHAMMNARQSELNLYLGSAG